MSLPSSLLSILRSYHLATGRIVRALWDCVSYAENTWRSRIPPRHAETHRPERIKLEYKRLAGEAVSAAKKDVEDIVSSESTSPLCPRQQRLLGRLKAHTVLGLVGREAHSRRERHPQSGAVSEAVTIQRLIDFRDPPSSPSFPRPLPHPHLIPDPGPSHSCGPRFRAVIMVIYALNGGTVHAQSR